MKKIRLYHGSENIIKIPQYHFGNPKNDYGYGFYCTESLDLANEWGCSEEKDGFANEYELDMAGLSVLNLSDSGYNILNWLAILLENRTFDLSNEVSVAAKDYILKNFHISYDQYDIIRGYRADTRIIMSFVATCTTVYTGLPFVSVLHTKTIAVQGAAPSRTAPARYSVASSGVINALNTINRKRYAIPYIVKGLISQFVTHVMINPFGFLPICFML